MSQSQESGSVHRPPTVPAPGVPPAAVRGRPGPVGLPSPVPVEPGAEQEPALFSVPADRLGQRLHTAVFGALPSATARALDVPGVAQVVRPLLDAGWRPAQLAARVGALPAAGDPVHVVVEFLTRLRERDSPQQTWERERAARERTRADQARTDVASPAASASWAAQVRRDLGLRPRVRPEVAVRSTPPCSACQAPSQFFVTRQVRLCDGCVTRLAAGSVHLAESARAG